ncbi:flagellar basal body P-ring protein FlgI [Diaphorobacter sp. JS3051]|uniref:flagellar basal body P-ring protein FlgI n=1 Tax=Diaphorobacter sp. JS3051 TaxID=2792224 RepID=UPI0018CA3A08|nr:flagellar basal body P-ring protein FlgI [Diaphorobacter sp. JS3051]QPN30139.1 flagellar basal body P-ring protein FlgI [Diaphorobacter sp. JS3051]
MKALPYPHIVHWLLALAIVLGMAAPAQAVRLKEIAAVQGVRSNQLSGYGLVVGLDKGDSASVRFTAQTMQNYLQQMGISLPVDAGAPQLKNVAAVVVTAQLPAFAQPGQSIDVTVSSIGDAPSVKGGTLIATPLRGADGEIYAMAQGNVVVPGAGAAGGRANTAGDRSSVQVNHLRAGRIPGGAQVERTVPTPLHDSDTITLNLNASDFQTARKVAQAINARGGANTATALDGRTVQVRAPQDPGARVNFIAELEELQLPDSSPAAKVVINARTGSIVLNQAVTLGPCAIAHGNLSITISETPVISQPNPLSLGTTVSVVKSDIAIQADAGRVINVPPSPLLSDVVRALNSLGVTPQDLLAILQAIKAAGALNAELEVI